MALVHSLSHLGWEIILDTPFTDRRNMLTILIVNHNTKQHLENALLHLEEQAETWDEVIVVDNASSDGSREFLRERYPSVRLLELPDNLGFGVANNRGVEIALGDQILLLNSDAWLSEGALPSLAEALDANPQLGAVTPALHYPDGRHQFAWAPETSVLGEALQKVRNRLETRSWAHHPPPRWLVPLLGPIWLTAACLLVRKSAFEAVGGFDESFFLYFEDVDLCRRLRLCGWELEVVQEARAFHVKGGSELSDRAELEYRRSQLAYYSKHRPQWENRLLRFKLHRKFLRLPDSNLRNRLLEIFEN
jgi:GT2 family glycosyltransferase